MKHYDDIDYDQFLYPHRNPDYQPDLHWNFLPAAEIAKLEAANPPQHKILLVPADPDYSPTEDELWPAVHQAVLDCLAPTPSSATPWWPPSARSSPTTEAGEILSLTIAEWQNNPSDLVQTNHFSLSGSSGSPTRRRTRSLVRVWSCLGESSANAGPG